MAQDPLREIQNPTLPQILADAHAAAVITAIKKLRPAFETGFAEPEIGRHLPPEAGGYTLRVEDSYADVANAMPMPEDRDAAKKLMRARRLATMKGGWGGNPDTIPTWRGTPAAVMETKKYDEGARIGPVLKDLEKMAFTNHLCGLPAGIGLYLTDLERTPYAARIERINEQLGRPVTAQSAHMPSVYDGDDWHWCFAIWWFPACTISLDHDALQKRIQRAA